MGKYRFLLFISLLTLFGCAANRFAKKGQQFEQAGMYKRAVDMYYTSLTKKANHVDATIGLKRAGQKSLDNLLTQFMELYKADESKEAVYKYVDCNSMYEKAKRVGVELDLPISYKEYYNEVREIYLNELYDEAYLLLEDEEFAKAEIKFNEILKLDSNYGDVAELKRKAHYEPIYRIGKQQLINMKYRSAYYSFKEIISALNAYKDSRELMEMALNNALLTIAVADFNNLTRLNGIEKQIKASVESALNKLKSPFIVIIDRENQKDITNEQLLTLEGKVDAEVSSKAGKQLGAKAILTAEVINYEMVKGDLKKQEKKGYLREIKKKKKDGIEEKKTVYHKTKYYEYNQTNKVTCKFQFKLISTETSEILVTDAISVTRSDEVHYITYGGNADNLVKGNWVSMKKKSPKDEIKDNSHDNRELKRLSKANKNIKSIEILQNEVQAVVADKVANKIYHYDPEK